jgi:hypothetical protein
MIRSPAIESTRRSLSPLKGADHPAATMLPNVQVTSRRTRALGIFKGAGSAEYRLLGQVTALRLRGSSQGRGGGVAPFAGHS